MAGCCEHCNELLDFIKFREFFCLAEELLASKEGLCSMELEIILRYLGSAILYIPCL